MHLGRAAVTAIASIGARQLGHTIFPDAFCQPQCPQCKDSVTSPFDYATSCQPNSSFLVNCGSCQTCVWTYALVNPDFPNMAGLEAAIETLLDLCLNTTASSEVEALQSQVTKLSILAEALTSGHAPTTTYSEFTITKTDASETWTLTGVESPHWTTMLSTATWASDYYSKQSAASAASLASAVSAEQTQTASSSTITAAPVAQTGQPSVNESAQPPRKLWIIGPVVGSVLGLTTVFFVIFFRRRRTVVDAPPVAVLEDIEKEGDDPGDDSGESMRAMSQTRPESLDMTELENHEVYEMPATEPAGSELGTPEERDSASIEEWPLPITPLRALFAMTEIRDDRVGHNDSPQHETFYNV